MNGKNFRTVFIAALLAALSLPAFADGSCKVSSLIAVGFGAYDVFSRVPNNNGVGSLTIRCNGGQSPAVVTLSAGQSNSYAYRLMTSGPNSLKYNLYTSAARSIVWGDGTGGSSTMTIAKNTSTTLGVFGQIAAGQDASVGTYTDSILESVEF
jgi:spore coat protein U-like protein